MQNKSHARIARNATKLFLMVLLLISCSSPHQQIPFNSSTGHPSGWNSPQGHGAWVKTQSDGFQLCKECHGDDYSGGISKVACQSCHGVNAPHAPAPWISTNGNVTHSTTNPANAGVCFGCHANGKNSKILLGTPAPAGTSPGCFNNTLCHGIVGHPDGWDLPGQHGTAAKSQNGFSLCQECHGSDFGGGDIKISCFICHGVNAPHAQAPWLSSSFSHTTTDPGNAAVCVKCHAGGSNSHIQPYPAATAGTIPGCYNGTLCHTGHSATWSLPSNHGVSAESDFSACQGCHGADYLGGTANTSCFECHSGPGLNHPAPAWVIYDHKTVAQTDNTGCQKCHGSDFLGGGAHIACNSCHMEDQTSVHALAWASGITVYHGPYVDLNGTTKCQNRYCHGPSLSGVLSSGPSCTSCHVYPITSCTSCHGTPPDGTAFPNVAGSHAVHMGLNPSINCQTCHYGTGPGSAYHGDGIVEVWINPIYSGKTGTATYNPNTQTCSNISCHGDSRVQTLAQALLSPPQSTIGTTPAWGANLTAVVPLWALVPSTVTIDMPCEDCHIYAWYPNTTELNNYWSGKHDLHLFLSTDVSPQPHLNCTDCHDPSLLASVHFNSFNTPMLSSAATITSFVGYDGLSCSKGCHGYQIWGK